MFRLEVGELACCEKRFWSVQTILFSQDLPIHPLPVGVGFYEWSSWVSDWTALDHEDVFGPRPRMTEATGDTVKGREGHSWVFQEQLTPWGALHDYWLHPQAPLEPVSPVFFPSVSHKRIRAQEIVEKEAVFWLGRVIRRCPVSAGSDPQETLPQQ